MKVARKGWANGQMGKWWREEKLQGPLFCECECASAGCVGVSARAGASSVGGHPSHPPSTRAEYRAGHVPRLSVLCCAKWCALVVRPVHVFSVAVGRLLVQSSSYVTPPHRVSTPYFSLSFLLSHHRHHPLSWVLSFAISPLRSYCYPYPYSLIARFVSVVRNSSIACLRDTILSSPPPPRRW